MKMDKRLKKAVEKYALESFSKDGEVLEKRVREYTKALKLLPRPLAIAGLSEYLKRLKSQMQESALEIESAVALSPAQIKQVTKVMKEKHPVTKVETCLNDGLLGGVKVKIGDMVYDDSLSQKLVQLKEAIV